MATAQPNNYGIGNNAVDSRISSNGSSTSSNNGAQTSSGTSSNNGVTTSNSTTSNMSAANQAALQQLIQQLLGGGTAEQRQQRAVRDGEIETTQGIRQDYSKSAAFADAQGLIAQQMRRALESMLPSINRAAEDAGSSGGALRALLLQDAASKAAESSSALGVQTVTNYGGISANLSQVLEQLTRSDPTVTNALINALGISKGAVSTTSTTGTTSQTGSTSNNSTSNSNTSTKENKNQNTDYAPFAVTANTSPLYFGPTADANAGTGIGSTLDTLRQLAGDTAWSNYQF